MFTKYEKYLLPGAKYFELVLLGDSDVLLQELDDGILLHQFRRNVLIVERIIDKISIEKAESMTLLDETEGADLSHCLFLAWRSRKNILDVLAGYIQKSPTHGGIIAVDFYSDRQS
jgi:hypothetical protein